MITGIIKNKVDKIWTDIWAGGITNPLTVIEQLTYLMFIRSLDEKELEAEDFENMSGEKIINRMISKLFISSLWMLFSTSLVRAHNTISVSLRLA